MKLPVREEPWYAAGLQFECTSCGNCCTGGPGYVWISDREISRLAEHLGVPVAEVERRYCRKIEGKMSLREKPRNARGEYDCIFLKEVPAVADGGQNVQHSRRICEVYSVRPTQCRTWPFWEGNLMARGTWDSAARRCPGMNSGKTWSTSEINQRRGLTK